MCARQHLLSSTTWSFIVLQLFVVHTSEATNWASQSSGTAEKLRTASFPSASAGYVVGKRGTIVATTDGGTTWSSLNSGSNTDLWGLSFPSLSVGFISGNSGTILYTNDGGSSWSSQSSGVTGDLWGLHFLSTTTGFVVGHGGVVLSTSDAGTTWTQQPSTTTKELWGTHFPDSNTGFVVGAGGTILRSTNGGTSWTQLTSGTNRALHQVHFLTVGNGYVVGAYGTILSTPDGGDSWSTLTTPTTAGLYGLAFSGSTTGYAAGKDGSVWLSGDGGNSWSIETLGTTEHFWGISCSATHAYAVGASGQIYSTLTPTSAPTKAPTKAPTPPALAPTGPSKAPTKAPTLAPTNPTKAPTKAPTNPTKAPTKAPTNPTNAPTELPTSDSLSGTPAPSPATDDEAGIPLFMIIAVAGGLLLCCCAALFLWLCRRRKKKQGLMVVGPPLLTASSRLDKGILYEHGLHPGSALLATGEHMDIFLTLLAPEAASSSIEEVVVRASGMSQLIGRATRALLDIHNVYDEDCSVSCVGAVGSDELATLNEKNATEAGMHMHLHRSHGDPTGIAALLYVKDEAPTSIGSMGAGTQLSPDYMKSEAVAAAMERSHLFYTTAVLQAISGFHEPTLLESVLYVGKHAASQEKLFCADFSAGFPAGTLGEESVTIQTDAIEKLLPLVDILFMNAPLLVHVQDALASADSLSPISDAQISPDKVARQLLLRMMTQSPDYPKDNKNRRKRMVVIRHLAIHTKNPGITLVTSDGSQFIRYVPFDESFSLTEGVEALFVGGFLSQLIRYRESTPLELCAAGCCGGIEVLEKHPTEIWDDYQLITPYDPTLDLKRVDTDALDLKRAIAPGILNNYLGHTEMQHLGVGLEVEGVQEEAVEIFHFSHSLRCKVEVQEEGTVEVEQDEAEQVGDWEGKESENGVLLCEQSPENSLDQI